jgi:hypothetical protein
VSLSARILVFALLSSSAPAAADERPHALVLPSRVTSKIASPMDVAHKMDARLADVARTSGYALLPPKFSPEEASCADAECMRVLAESRGAEVIVRADLFFAPAASRDVVQVVLFRRSVPRSMRTEEQPCTGCDDQHAVARTADLGLRLLRSDPGTGTPPLEPLNLLPPTFASSQPPPVNHRRTVFKALGYTSLGLALGSLGLAIGTGVIDNSCSQSVGGTCIQRVDTTGAIVTGAVLTAAFAAACTAFLIVGHRAAPRRSTAVTWAPDGSVRF